jgi:hypothetical protein
MPKTGGFSVANDALPSRTFQTISARVTVFNRGGNTFMPCHHINFIAFNLACQLDRGFAHNDFLS